MSKIVEKTLALEIKLIFEKENMDSNQMYLT